MWCHLVSGHAAALRLGVPDQAVGEGAARAGGAGVPAYSAVAGHLACGVTTTGDNGAGVQAFLTILNRILILDLGITGHGGRPPLT